MVKRLLRLRAAWFLALLAWFSVLWIASSMPGTGGGPPIPHLDKFLHFSYFFVGGALLAGWQFLGNRANPRWIRILITTIVVMAAIGWTDEQHQRHTPNRDGGSKGDWIADILGATAGALTLRALHRRI